MENCRDREKNTDEQFFQNLASYFLYSRRYDPSKLGSSLFQNSSLNRKYGEICNILGYRGPNGIPKDFLEREWTPLSLVQISDSEDEPMTRGMPYNFVVLNSPVTGHLG